jgi:hypothetical protein
MDEYRPIPLETYRWIIHKEVTEQYAMLCDDREASEEKVHNWAELIELIPRCEVYIPGLNYFLRGPVANLPTNRA